MGPSSNLLLTAHGVAWGPEHANLQFHGPSRRLLMTATSTKLSCAPRRFRAQGSAAHPEVAKASGLPRRLGNVDKGTEGGAIERIVGSQLNNAGAITRVCSWQAISGRPARSWLDVCMQGSSKACLWSRCQIGWAACCRRRHTSPPALAGGRLIGPRLLGARPDCWAGHLLSAAALTAALAAVDAAAAALTAAPAAVDAAAAAAAVQVVLCCAARRTAVTEG